MEYVDLSAYIDVPVLIAVYVLAEIGKHTCLKTDKLRSLIPLMSVLIGGLISALIFILYPEGSSSINVFNAIVCGAVSGAAATGSNQIYKQIKKFFTTSNEKSSDKYSDNDDEYYFEDNE